MSTWGGALGGAAEGSYEQEAAVVEEDEEMEREDERGVAKRPDLNELDVPDWAELALDNVEWDGMEEATAAHRPLEMETASRRQSATTRTWRSIGSAEIFAEGAAHTTTKWEVHCHDCAGLTRCRQGQEKPHAPIIFF
jgi:hypothetical protein